MKPLYLYLENFTCYKASELDLSTISSALVVGKLDHNELVSNGVGKTSIFRAIEYALFAQTRDPVANKDIVLEKLILDEAAKLLVVFDFAIDDQIYRISRARTRRGTTDLSFYRRNAVDGNPHTPITDKALWDSLSGRRTADTDAEITKLIRTNYKSFINTNHFMQLDMQGIATATPEKRRTLLKDVFELAIYAALEKIAKKRTDDILDEIKANKAILSVIGTPHLDVIKLNEQLADIDASVISQSATIDENKATLASLNEVYTSLLSQLSILETNSKSVFEKKQSLTAEVAKLQSSITEYTRKRKATLTEANSLNATLRSLQASKAELDIIDFAPLSALISELEQSQSEHKAKSIEIGILKAKLEELNIPMPDDGTCKHCRQVLTPEHRRVCMEDIENQKREKTAFARSLIAEIKSLAAGQVKLTKDISKLEQQQASLKELTANIANTTKELTDKKRVFEEYASILEQTTKDLAIKSAELEQARIDVLNSSEKEINDLKQQVADTKGKITLSNSSLDLLMKELNEHQAKRAVILHSIEAKTKDIERKTEVEQAILSLEDKYAIHPLVSQAFGAIPDMIIENVLEDLQEETNKLLAQVRPGLQLAFSTEKTRADGDQEDTLDIDYFLNNKPRDYSQLSGAQRLCVAFSLKLGLSFLLAKMNGSQIKFLLLDEVDQALDDAGIDALADIIKVFHSNFTILVITHNKRLQSRFSTAILVEQDKSMVSRAKVVNHW